MWLANPLFLSGLLSFFGALLLFEPMWLPAKLLGRASSCYRFLPPDPKPRLLSNDGSSRVKANRNLWSQRCCLRMRLRSNKCQLRKKFLRSRWKQTTHQKNCCCESQKHQPFSLFRNFSFLDLYCIIATVRSQWWWLRSVRIWLLTCIQSRSFAWMQCSDPTQRWCQGCFLSARRRLCLMWGHR